jgi:hypothetical protein
MPPYAVEQALATVTIAGLSSAGKPFFKQYAGAFVFVVMDEGQCAGAVSLYLWSWKKGDAQLQCACTSSLLSYLDMHL